MVEDRISELPDEVLFHILCLLPIKFAARTVALSRRWVKLFSSMPDLDFTSITASSGDELDSIIHNVLSGRGKDSNIRKLKMKSNLSSMTLDSLIEYARGSRIQDLDLNTPTLSFADIPFNMFMVNCECLKVLTLQLMCPTFNPAPGQAQSFKSLHTMALTKIFSKSLPIFTDAMFPRLKNLRLVSCHGLTALNFQCSELEDLVINVCSTLNQLDIAGLKLERLTVNSCFHNHSRDVNVKIIAPVIKYLKWVGNDIRHVPIWEKSPLLHEAAFGFSSLTDQDFADQILGLEETRRWSVIFKGLSEVKTLKLYYPSIEIFAKNDFHNTMLVNKFDNLTRLEIGTQVRSDNSLQGLATLFKTSPNIEVIKISSYHLWHRGHVHKGNKYWIDQIPDLTSFLNHLKLVEFKDFMEHEEEACSLAKFLLEHGKVLQNMILRLRPNTEQLPGRRMRSIIKKLPWTLSSKVTIL